MRKGIFERAYLNWHYRKDILMKDISERAFPKGHFDEGHFEGRAFPKGERAKGMKGIVHKLEFPQRLTSARSSVCLSALPVLWVPFLQLVACPCSAHRCIIGKS